MFSLNIFYLLKCAKGIRHKLSKQMKSSPIYNKLQLNCHGQHPT